MKTFRLNQEETKELIIRGVVNIYRVGFEFVVKWDDYANEYRATIVNDIYKIQLPNCWVLK